jgi:hypothetical protein
MYYPKDRGGYVEREWFPEITEGRIQRAKDVVREQGILDGHGARLSLSPSLTTVIAIF